MNQDRDLNLEERLSRMLHSKAGALVVADRAFEVDDLHTPRRSRVPWVVLAIATSTILLIGLIALNAGGPSDPLSSGATSIPTSRIVLGGNTPPTSQVISRWPTDVDRGPLDWSNPPEAVFSFNSVQSADDGSWNWVAKRVQDPDGDRICAQFESGEFRACRTLQEISLSDPTSALLIGPPVYVGVQRVLPTAFGRWVTQVVVSFDTGESVTSEPRGAQLGLGLNFSVLEIPVGAVSATVTWYSPDGPAGTQYFSDVRVTPPPTAGG